MSILHITTKFQEVFAHNCKKNSTKKIEKKIMIICDVTWHDT